MPQALVSPEWPSYSLNLRPIENIWGWFKNKVNMDAPRLVKALKKSIKIHWDSIDEDFFAPYFNSMYNRMEMLIENEGGRVNH